MSGVVTGELRDDDGSLVGVDSRRATLAVDLVRDGDRYVPVARAFQLDLMGILVAVGAPVLPRALAVRGRTAADRVPARRHLTTVQEVKRS